MQSTFEANSSSTHNRRCLPGWMGTDQRAVKCFRKINLNLDARTAREENLSDLHLYKRRLAFFAICMAELSDRKEGMWVKVHVHAGGEQPASEETADRRRKLCDQGLEMNSN